LAPSNPVLGKHEIDRIAGRICGAIQVCPASADLNVRLIDPPGTIPMAEFPSEPLIQKGRITLDPAQIVT
jgi:hypothetical protein